MDFVTAWKATSIVITGAFGVLGLVKDFKNRETGRITVWGRVSLAGILISSCCGVIAQLTETSRQEKSRALTAQQTLALAQKTDQAVQDLERLLDPLPDSLLFSIVFTAPCNGQFHSFCSSIGRDDSLNSLWPYTDAQLHEWPAGHPGPLVLDLDFFADQTGVHEFEQGVRKQGDLSIYLQGYLGNNSLKLQRDADTLYLNVSTAERGKPSALVYSQVETNGKIKSIIDLSGHTMLIRVGLNLRELTVHKFAIVLSPNRKIEIDVSRFERVTVRGEPGFRYIFPPLK